MGIIFVVMVHFAYIFRNSKSDSYVYRTAGVPVPKESTITSSILLPSQNGDIASMRAEDAGS